MRNSGHTLAPLAKHKKYCPSQVFEFDSLEISVIQNFTKIVFIFRHLKTILWKGGFDLSIVLRRQHMSTIDFERDPKKFLHAQFGGILWIGSYRFDI